MRRRQKARRHPNSRRSTECESNARCTTVGAVTGRLAVSNSPVPVFGRRSVAPDGCDLGPSLIPGPYNTSSRLLAVPLNQGVNGTIALLIEVQVRVRHPSSEVSFAMT